MPRKIGNVYNSDTSNLKSGTIFTFLIFQIRLILQPHPDEFLAATNPVYKMISFGF
jgi:hypothetical protein